MEAKQTIWIVKKHPRISYRGGTATIKAFEIFSTHATRPEAKFVAKMKNAKAKDYEYMVGKVALNG